MKDARLEAGRHHLQLGTLALSSRSWTDAESAFRSALLQFSGPDLLIGAAHAYRGLGTVELARGQTAAAEALLRDAIQHYREVRRQLDELDGDGVGSEIRNDALEGEAISQVQLGDVLLRTGRDHEARESRDWARAAFDGAHTGTSVAGLHALTGRLALRDGELEEAETSYRMAVDIYAEAKDSSGQSNVLRALAEVARLRKDFDHAQELLIDARRIARDAGDRVSELRALAGLGSLAMHAGDPNSGILAYDQVLAFSHQLGDDEMLGYAHLNLGQLRSITRRGKALEHLRSAVRILGSLGISHGVGAAMHHVAAHALILEQPEYALAAAEGARRLWRSMDPVRGVGQAMRLEVKALAALGEPRALLAVAYARANLVGHTNHKAIEVRDHYRRRADAKWVAVLESLDPTQLYRTAEDEVRAVLNPFLFDNSWTVNDLTVTSNALALIDALSQIEAEAPLEELAEDAIAPLAAADSEAVSSTVAPYRPYFVLAEDEDSGIMEAPPDPDDA